MRHTLAYLLRRLATRLDGVVYAHTEMSARKALAENAVRRLLGLR
jgi:hypothetical protein